MPAKARRRSTRRSWTFARKLKVGSAALSALLLAYAAWSYATLPDVSYLRERNPTTSALIELRSEEALEAGLRPRRKQHWVGLAQVAKHAVDAVLLSEDATFFQHEGVDTREMKKALVDSWERGKLGRGASTLTMQLAKNLWLSTDRSLGRKVKELVLTSRLEKALPKKRILTLYLNIAEWGEGVYGIEAASREHFGVSAWELRPAQSVVLASMLPAPRTWIPSRRPKRLYTRAVRLLGRLESAGRLTPDEVSDAREDLEEMFAGAQEDN